MALGKNWNGKLLIVTGTASTKEEILGPEFSGNIKHVFWHNVVTAADLCMLEDSGGPLLPLSAPVAAETLGPQNWNWPFRKGLWVSDMDSGTLYIYFNNIEEPIRA